MQRQIHPHQIPRQLTGLAAMALLVWLAVNRLNDERAVLILLASAFLVLICLTDTLQTRIPNFLTLALALAGTGYHVWVAGAAGLASAVLGLLTGFVLLLGPYLLGGMGAGDVKALAALGTLFGPFGTFQVFLYMGLAGGVLALLHYLLTANLRETATSWVNGFKVLLYTGSPRTLLSRKTETLRFPYAAAIAFGFFAFEYWGRLV